MGKRGNGEGSIYPFKRDGVKVGYRGSYTVHTASGPKRRYVSGKTREDVRHKLTKAMAGRDTGLVVDDKNMSFGEFLDAWISDTVRGTVRESTLWRDKSLIANHIKPALGRIKLKNLNAIHLQGMYRDRLDRGISEDKGLSGSTVQKIHHIVHKALDQAVKWDLIPRNPADGVKAPTPSSKEMRPLSADETRKLLGAAKGNRLEALYVVAVHTGMRRGELLGLKWEDADLDGDIPRLRVRRTLTLREGGKKLALGEPKTKASRPHRAPHTGSRRSPQATPGAASRRAVEGREPVRRSRACIRRRVRRPHEPLEPPPAVVHATATGRRTPPDHLPRPPAHVRLPPFLEERPSEVRPGTPRTRSGGDHP